MKLSADQLHIDGATAYVVAEGEVYHSTGCKWTPRSEHDCRCKGRPGAPFWMEVADEVPIHTFEVECPLFREHVEEGLDDCTYGCNSLDGTISYRLAVREVLEVYDFLPQRVRMPFVTLSPYPEYWERGESDPITLPPAAKPGMYLAICEVAS